MPIRTLRGRCLLLSCALVLVFGAASASAAPEPGSDSAGDPYFPQDGNGGYRVAHYDLALRVDPESKQVDGTMTITAVATKDLSSFNLDFADLGPVRTQVNGKPAAAAHAEETELVVTPDRPLPSGKPFTATVAYSFNEQEQADALGRPELPGWVRTTSGGVAKFGEPGGAEYWFPSNNTPGNKASFKLTLTVPEGWIGLGGGKETPAVTKDGWTTSVWDEPNPVAMYLVPLAVDHFDVRRYALPAGQPVVVALNPDQPDYVRAAADRYPEVMAFLQEKLGPYPHSGAGGIFIDPGPGNQNFGGALETQTRPTYVSNWKDVDGEISVIVHENAHEWYGDSVSVRQWRDICLNECFASYLQWMWEEAKEGQDLDQKYRDRVRERWDDEDYWGHLLTDMCDGKEECDAGDVMNGQGVYDKGQLALHALRRLIGDKAFGEILRGWPVRHSFGNASWTEFEQYVQQATRKDLGAFFHAWFHSGDRPADEYLFPGSLAQ
ncbi:M1 family metallopeptidase [Segniliparus rugosus]|uniref:M1 family metallopeptidase n=1 Tax=Segniliparus rugosus TaxID=286804 RepID=UPI000A0752E6|nr:M1 family metallopeptidase [Segniliparus rugosus]